MSDSCKLLLGVSTSYLFDDPEHLSCVRNWLVEKYSYAQFAQIPERAIPDTVTFWYCDDIEGLDQKALLQEIAKYSWSDMMFLMISSNGGPFELTWDWRKQHASV